MKTFFFLKNRLLIAFILFFNVVNVWSQAPDMTGIEHPQFIGGEAAFVKYISKNYPIKARLEGIEGKILINFVVEADGAISEAKILDADYYKSVVFSFSKKIKRIRQLEDQEPVLYHDMNKLILAVINKMPKWIAGTKDGQAVRMNCTLSLVYKLDESTAPVETLPQLLHWFF